MTFLTCKGFLLKGFKLKSFTAIRIRATVLTGYDPSGTYAMQKCVLNSDTVKLQRLEIGDGTK